MDKTLLFTGFRSRHYFRFFGKRVNTSVFLRSARQKIGSKSATHAVIYRGLVPSRAKNIKNYVNISVSASKSCQNIAIYSVSCLPRFLKLQKHCKYQIFLRSMCQNAVIYSVFCFAFKNVSKRRFFPILGTLKMGGKCSWRRLWATEIPSKKLFPAEWRIFGVFWGPAPEGRRLGRASP